jgi:hypothetical protein
MAAKDWVIRSIRLDRRDAVQAMIIEATDPESGTTNIKRLLMDLLRQVYGDDVPETFESDEMQRMMDYFENRFDEMLEALKGFDGYMRDLGDGQTPARIDDRVTIFDEQMSAMLSEAFDSE